MKFVIWLTLGLALGPTLLDLPLPTWFSSASFWAGGLFLFFAGWELKFLGIGQHAKFFAVSMIGAFLFPLVVGYFMFEHNVFLAVAISISALPVAIQILKEKNAYNSDFGRRAITIASLCDIIAWLIMGFIFPSENLQSWIVNHWAVGAFFVGLAFGRFVPMVRWAARWQTWFFAPLLFVGLGWKIDLVHSFSFMTCAKIFMVAVLAKGLGSYVVMRAQKLAHRESLEFAAILNARGAMEILAAGLAFAAGLIDASVLSALVVLGVLTSVMAVPLVRKRAA